VQQIAVEEPPPLAPSGNVFKMLGFWFEKLHILLTMKNIFKYKQVYAYPGIGMKITS